MGHTSAERCTPASTRNLVTTCLRASTRTFWVHFSSVALALAVCLFTLFLSRASRPPCFSTETRWTCRSRNNKAPPCLFLGKSARSRSDRKYVSLTLVPAEAGASRQFNATGATVRVSAKGATVAKSSDQRPTERATSEEADALIDRPQRSRAQLP